MKYCLKWTNLCQNLKNVDEISIKYIEDKGLLDFMKKYAGKRIILRVIADGFAESEVAKLVAINNQFPEYKFAVALDKVNTALIKTFTEKEVPFYIQEPVQDWETLNYYTTQLGVCDIDISGPLGFELPKVKKFLDDLNLKVNIRMTPNYARGGTENCPPLKRFFVRPEDIDQYEPYVDIIEFAGIDNQDTFYQVYAKGKSFIGKLNQVIYNFPHGIENIALIPQFTERRIACGRTCLSGGYCHRCETLTGLSQKMAPQVREKIMENIRQELKEKSSEL